ncbi:SRPBCC family protein [Streptomyces sp. NPDC057910]|uniref:SRPBCC family protein n=1 Tax=Streptomyces sp. NPDC057910 TaxID=3346278 RepID=UPI0036E3EBA5
MADIHGVTRIETTPRDTALARLADRTHAVYPHDEVYGQFCTVQDYIDCPPQDVYRYLSDTRSLQEWTYSLRDLRETGQPELFVAQDRIGEDTDIYIRTMANPEAMTVDYHCAWDQGEELWMIYLMRVVPAEQVLGRPGSVVLWTNCRHPYYDSNPHPELAPAQRPVWVGDVWHLFFAGHRLELDNLKAILEHRHANHEPIAAFEPLAAVAVEADA